VDEDDDEEVDPAALIDEEAVDEGLDDELVNEEDPDEEESYTVG
jgi:hypothetical protein